MQQVEKIEAKTVKDCIKDAILDGEITAITKTTWREYLTGKGREKNISSFDNPDEPILSITYKTNEGATDSEQVTYYSEPSERTKLGRILRKYGDIQIGTKIKVEFDGEGYSSIKLDKKAKA